MTAPRDRAQLLGHPPSFGSDPQQIVRTPTVDPVKTDATKVMQLGGRLDLRDSRLHRMLARLILGE